LQKTKCHPWQTALSQITPAILFPNIISALHLEKIWKIEHTESVFMPYLIQNHQKIRNPRVTQTGLQYVRHLLYFTDNTSSANDTDTTTVLWPFFQDHPGEPVPDENFWTLWYNGRSTEAETPTIRLGAIPSGLTSAHLHHPLK